MTLHTPDYGVPTWRSVVPDIHFPCIGEDASAHLQSLLFQLEHTQWLPAEVIRQRQLHQLRQLLRHAARTVPYYRELLRDVKMERLDWTTFESLPILQRKTLQVNFEMLRSANVPPRHGAVSEGLTSGSTGTPVRFQQTAASQLFWNALTLREHLWQKRDFSGKLAAIRIKTEDRQWPDWGAPARLVFRTGPATTLNVRTDVSAQLDWLLRENPDYLITHASNLAALAELTIRRGISLPRLRQARSYSEALRPGLRELVREAWGVDVADAYSCEEAGYLALQCPAHEHYHVQSENVLVEILDESGRPCGAGETGRVVVTPLHNFAMPLLRYDLQDYAVMGEACDCGRGLPAMRRIHGRLRNMIVLPDGRRHWPSFPRIRYAGIAPISQIRIVQRSLEKVEAIFTAQRQLADTEVRGMIAAIQESLGYPFAVQLTQVDEMPRRDNMKFEDIMSDVAPDQFGARNT